MAAGGIPSELLVELLAVFIIVAAVGRTRIDYLRGSEILCGGSTRSSPVNTNAGRARRGHRDPAPTRLRPWRHEHRRRRTGRLPGVLATASSRTGHLRTDDARRRAWRTRDGVW